MSKVKDPAKIKLFGRMISLPLTPEESSRKELSSAQHDDDDDDDASHQSTGDLKSPTTSSANAENPKTPSAERASTNGNQSQTSVSQEKPPKKPDKLLGCPRCNSMDTKFCYYNNYKVNQPRYFCKNCQRYWTDGGSMRNVAVGAGRRKNKNSTASHHSHMMVPEALQHPKFNVVMGNGSAVLNFGSDHHSPLGYPMASVLNIAEKTQNGIPSSTSSEKRNHAASCETVNKSQLPGPYPWNSAQWNCPVSFCTNPAYWGRNVIPCISPQSFVNHSAPCSGPNSPALGKHSRDGNMLTPANSQKEKPGVVQLQHNRVLIPKTLRIDDPSEAAKSTIWSTLGIKNEKANSLNGRGLFKPFPSMGNDKNQIVQASRVLHANPAALSRSLTFHEQT